MRHDTRHRDLLRAVHSLRYCLKQMMKPSKDANDAVIARTVLELTEHVGDQNWRWVDPQAVLSAKMPLRQALEASIAADKVS